MYMYRKITFPFLRKDSGHLWKLSAETKMSNYHNRQQEFRKLLFHVE
jgi:hypothetical protein